MTNRKLKELKAEHALIHELCKQLTDLQNVPKSEEELTRIELKNKQTAADDAWIENIQKTRNRKYDKALILLMKRQPENIMMCPYCLNIHYASLQDIRIETRTQLNHYCNKCGKHFYGKSYLIFCDDLKMHIKRFFSEEPVENHNIDHFIDYCIGEKTHWWYFPSEIDREHNE